MKTLLSIGLAVLLLAAVGCKKGDKKADDKKKAPKKQEIVVEYKGKKVKIDKALAFWTNDWTLRVYAVTNCKQFACNHIKRGWRTKEFKTACPDAGIYGVQFKAHWGIKMRAGKWSYQKTDNEPIDARPYTLDKKNKVSGWWGKGGSVELVSLSDTAVSVNADYKDKMGRTYKGKFSATICKPKKQPETLKVSGVTPPPHKPLLPKAKLMTMAPKLPAKFATDYEYKAWFPTDGSISWHLKNKKTGKTVLAIRIRDKRNYLYERSTRSRKLFAKYPMTRFKDTWMWTYVGNFNIDISTTGYKDAQFKKDAVLDELFKGLDLAAFEKL